MPPAAAVQAAAEPTRDPAPNAPKRSAPVETANAGEDDEVMDAELEGLLSEVVVAGASRTAESGRDAPATVEVISATELRVYGIRTLSEAFNYLSLAMYSEAAPGASETGARGVSFTSDFGSHVLLLFDGHVVNSAGSGLAWFDRVGGVPIASVDRIEIIYGPGSVLYGVNAMTAVVNVVMKKGADIDGVDGRFEASWSPNVNRYGNIDELVASRSGHREELIARFGKAFEIGNTNGDVLIHASFLADQLPKAELGPQYSADARDLFDFGDRTGSGDPTVWGGYAGTRATMPHVYARVRIENFTLTGWGNWTSSTNPGFSLEFPEGTRQRWTQGYLDGQYDYVVSTKVSGLVRLYGDHLMFRNTLSFPGQLFCGTTPAPCAFDGQTEEYRGGLENQWSFDWFADGRYVTMVGADGRVIGNRVVAANVDSLGNVVSFDRQTGDDVGGAVGAYAQQIMRVHPKVSLNVGARYDYFLGKQAVSPRGAAVFSPWKGGTLKLLYSQAFRAPSVTEISQAQQDLRPEVVRSTELAVGQVAGPHRLKLSIFAGAWSDVIRRIFEANPDNPGSTEFDYGNLDLIWQLGGSAGYSARLGKFSYGVNASYGWGRNRLGGWGAGDVTLTDDELAESGTTRAGADRFGRNQPLGASPGFTGNFRLAYAIGDRLPTLALTGYVLGPRVIKDIYADSLSAALIEEDDDAIVPTTFTGRAIVSQEFTRMKWGSVGYRLWVEATSNNQTPHTVGPFKAATRDDYQTSFLELNQVARLSVFGGFHVTFGRGRTN